MPPHLARQRRLIMPTSQLKPQHSQPSPSTALKSRFLPSQLTQPILETVVAYHPQGCTAQESPTQQGTPPQETSVQASPRQPAIRQSSRPERLAQGSPRRLGTGLRVGHVYVFLASTDYCIGSCMLILTLGRYTGHCNGDIGHLHGDIGHRD